MQEKNIYEYSVIRLVPKIEREEFLNIGIILFSKQAKYIKVDYYVDKEKLKCLIDLEELYIDCVYSVLEAFYQISLGSEKGGCIGKMDIPERFRWLTSERSTIIQTSRPHPGFSSDLDQTFKKLFAELVL